MPEQGFQVPRAACAFRVGEDLLGVDVAWVGEHVVVERLLRLPLCAPGVLGLFNLRGVPTTLVDSYALLGHSGPTPAGKTTALVLRFPELSFALRVDRLEGVFSCRPERVRWAAGQRGAAVAFFEPLERPGLSVRLLRHEEEIVEPANRLRFTDSATGSRRGPAGVGEGE